MKKPKRGNSARQFAEKAAEKIIEQLKKVQEMYPGLEHVNVGSAIGTPHAVVMEQMERFGKEVMPAFTGQVIKSEARVAAS